MKNYSPSKSFIIGKIQGGFASLVSFKIILTNSDRGYYRKWIWAFTIICQMIAKYLSWCLADLDSV